MAVLQTGLAKSLAEDYTVDQSLRFNDGDSAYLSRTQTAGNRKTWTWSCWAKKAALGATLDIFGTPTEGDGLRWYGAADLLNFLCNGSTDAWLVTDRVFRDVGSWYHIVLTFDTTESVAADRIKLYINGVQETSFSSANYPDEDDEFKINQSGQVFSVGRGHGNNYLDGYLAEVYFIDGTAYDADDFGEIDTATNQWKPIDASDLTFGTNGFYQKYAATELNDSFSDSRVADDAKTFTPTESLSVDVLLVGGGGGGWGSRYSAGGAGGMVTSTSFSVTAQEYPIVVGAGGMPQAAGTVITTDGLDTTFSTLTAYGGGGGGKDSSAGRPGGCGGGGTDGYGGGTGSQGGNGGSGYTSGEYGAGGGGGAGGNGGNGSSTLAGDGGIGLANDYRTGVNITYAGGGGGGKLNTSGGTGGTGGGGNGGAYAGSTATNGTDGLGGGGGGGASGPNAIRGGTGGSGIVVIRYLASEAKATGGTITTYGAGVSQYYVHTFLEYENVVLAFGDVVNTRAGQTASVPGTSSFLFGGASQHDYLMIPPLTSWDVFESGSVFTLESWIKYTTAPTGSDYNDFISSQEDASNGWRFGYDAGTGTGGLWIWMKSGGVTKVDYYGNGSTDYKITDTDWHHVAMTKDGSALKAYLDGVEVISATDADSDTFHGILGISGGSVTAAAQFGGNMTEVRVSDSVRYTGAFTPQTTQFTTDSNTLLLLHSDWDGGPGADSSGNENDFAATNLVASDKMVDSPTNNFAIFNPLIGNTGSGAQASYVDFSEGNLKAVGNYGSETGLAPGTFSFGTGKWYVEFVATSLSGAYPHLGIIETTSATTQGGYVANSVVYKADGGIVEDSTSTGGWGDSWVAGDVIGMAIDCTNGAVYFAKNNTWQDSGVPTSGATKTGAALTWTGESIDFVTTTSPYTTSAGVVMNCGQDSSFAGNKTAQGNQDSNEIGDFYYEPPTDFLALCTDNLPDPEIKLPADNFNTLLYDDGAGAKTGLGFQPDMVWVKARGATNSHKLTDSVRGVEEALTPDTTAAQTTYDQGLLAFGTDGFTVGTDDHFDSTTGSGMVAWSWLGANGTATNETGDITSTVSANSTAGFSIVKYTGDDTSGSTVGHGLSETPQMVILKKLTATADWVVYSEIVGATAALSLNEDIVPYTYAAYFNNTAPTASVFSLGDYTGVNASSNDYVAYCFHSVEGYSKIGSYEGNNNADGTFIYTGFRPAWIMMKNIDSAQPWMMSDDKRSTYNVVVDDLQANNYNTESTGSLDIDYVSNGFKCRTTNVTMNAANTYLYLAYAEYPFKHSPAR